MKSKLFWFIGFMGALLQVFSFYVIMILIGCLTKAWLTVIIITILFTSIDIWRHNDLKEKGFKPELGRYKK